MIKTQPRHMNLRAFVTITGLLILLTGCATHTTTAAKATQSNPEAPARLYFEAFHDGDFNKLKAAITKRFMAEVGKANWKRNLDDNHAKYRASQYTLIRLKPEQDSAIAGIQIGLKAGDESVWLSLIRQKDGVWKVDNILGDYIDEEQ